MAPSQTMGVSYTLSAFKRAQFIGGDKHLLLKADQDAALALQALREAANAVTDDLYEYEIRDEAYVSLDAPVPTPQGPMARVRDCEPAKALPLMLDHLVAELSARGITGRLLPAKTAADSHFGHQSFPALGMLLSPLNDTYAMYAAYEAWKTLPAHRGLWVDTDRHHRVVSVLMEWVAEVEGTVLVHSVGAIEVDPDGLVAYVSHFLRSEPWLRVSATTPDNRRRRQVTFADSEVILCDYDPDHSRLDQLALLTALATRLAPDVAYALIRELSTSTISIAKFGRMPPAIRLFEGVAHTTMFKHLEADYVSDAGVAQVLTGSQLSKSELPTERWAIEDLGNDRHLVTSLDPEVWLHPDPHFVHTDPRTLPPDWTNAKKLATSRADFGPAIISLGTLRQHPPPLTPEQIQTDPTLRTLGVVPLVD